MRVNIYSQEMTPEVLIVSSVSKNGVAYKGVRFVLKSADALHNTPDDDDRSAVTFWLPSKSIRLVDIANTFQRAASMIADLNAYDNAHDNIIRDKRL